MALARSTHPRALGLIRARAGSAAAAARADLRACADADHATGAAAYFKTGPGEYGEGDVFLGVRAADLRRVARAYAGLSRIDLATLLASPVHEERLLALVILVAQYTKGDAAARRACFAFYMRHIERVNNWDLVDVSAGPIAGEHARVAGYAPLLPRLARSKVLWKRRVAMIATFAFIRAGDPTPTFAIAEILLHDEHDLIHKAVGWMLREVGKRVGEPALRRFLRDHAAEMPRTALRYAIERLPDAERSQWLALRASRSGRRIREAAPGPPSRRARNGKRRGPTRGLARQ